MALLVIFLFFFPFFLSFFLFSLFFFFSHNFFLSFSGAGKSTIAKLLARKYVVVVLGGVNCCCYCYCFVKFDHHCNDRFISTFIHLITTPINHIHTHTHTHTYTHTHTKGFLWSLSTLALCIAVLPSSLTVVELLLMMKVRKKEGGREKEGKGEWSSILVAFFFLLFFLFFFFFFSPSFIPTEKLVEIATNAKFQFKMEENFLNRLTLNGKKGMREGEGEKGRRGEGEKGRKRGGKGDRKIEGNIQFIILIFFSFLFFSFLFFSFLFFSFYF